MSGHRGQRTGVPQSVFHTSIYESQHKHLPEDRRTLLSIQEQRGESLTKLADPKLVSPGMHKLTPDDSAPNDFINAHTMTYERTLLSDMFFSPKNQQNIQNLLKLLVHKHTGDTISNQSNRELSIIMNAIFLEYNRYPGDITPQNRETKIEEFQNEVHRLNQIVLNDIVPRVVSQIQSYQHYLWDSSNQPETIPRPENVNISGTRQYRSTTSILTGSDL